MVQYQIRAMQFADYQAVNELWLATEGIGLSDSDSPANIQAFLNRNPHMSAVAESPEGLIGTVLCGHDGRRGYIHHLAVAKTKRYQGIARALLDYCFWQLAEQGILKCNIFVFKNNPEGQTFWLHNGWQTRPDLDLLQRYIHANA